MKVIMKIGQLEFFQVIWIQKEMSSVRSHRVLRRVKKAEYDSTKRHQLLVFVVLFFELLTANSAWSLTSQADMNEHPEKRPETMNCIVEHITTAEVSLTFQNFAASIWRGSLGCVSKVMPLTKRMKHAVL